MKRCLSIFLILVLLLSGCGRDPQETKPSGDEQTQSSGVSENTEPTAPPQDPEPDLGLYEPDSAVEQATDGAVRKYALEGTGFYAVAVMGEGVLLFSGNQDTTLTYVQDGQDPIVATLTGMPLYPGDVSCRVTDQGLGYYDARTNEVVILDASLQESGRKALPQQAESAVALSADLNYAYYFDQEDLRYLDMDTGISRVLADAQGSERDILGLHFDDDLLLCMIVENESSRYVMVDTDTGSTVTTLEGAPLLESACEEYFAEIYQGGITQYIYGQREGDAFSLVPEKEYVMAMGLPQLHSVVFYGYTDSGFALDLYRTQDGTNHSAVVLDGLIYNGIAADPARERIWFLADAVEDGTQGLYCWDPEKSLTGDTTDYSVPYYSAQEPDAEGLARVAQQAKELGDRYGVRVLVYEEAVAQVPSEYRMEAEHLVPVYEKYLEVLEQGLAAYPSGLLRKLGNISGNGRLTICLVRGIYGNGTVGVLPQVIGLQYWINGNAYAAMILDHSFESTIYHEIFHMMDTYILTRTQAFDHWDSLNPEGFWYDNDYLANLDRVDDQYLQDADRSFIDTYSMSFATEDRARVMEFAMLPGNENFFISDTMHKKLQTICTGIREAFGLQDDPTVFLWEQYLEKG